MSQTHFPIILQHIHLNWKIYTKIASKKKTVKLYRPWWSTVIVCMCVPPGT